MEWWYAQGEERKGPASENELRTLIATGSVLRDTLVWRQGMDAWKPARQTELRQYFSAAAAVPPTPGAAAATATAFGTSEDAYRAPRADLAPGISAASIAQRPLWMVLLLSVVTCGIYSFYLVYRWSKDVNTALGREKYNPVVVLLASIVTLGFGAMVVECMMAFDLEASARRLDVPDKQQNLGAIVTGLQIGGMVLSALTGVGGLVTWLAALAMIQTELNRIAPRV